MSKDRVQELIDLNVITDNEIQPMIVPRDIANQIDIWAKNKGITSPTKYMTIFEVSDG